MGQQRNRAFPRNKIELMLQGGADVFLITEFVGQLDPAVEESLYVTGAVCRGRCGKAATNKERHFPPPAAHHSFIDSLNLILTSGTLWKIGAPIYCSIPSNFSQCPIDRSKNPENLPLWKIYGGVGEAGKTKKNASPGENFCKRIEQCVFMRKILYHFYLQKRIRNVQVL